MLNGKSRALNMRTFTYYILKEETGKRLLDLKKKIF